MIDLAELERLAAEAGIDGLKLMHECNGARREHVGDFAESEPVFELRVGKFSLSYYPIVDPYSSAGSQSIGRPANATRRTTVRVHCDFAVEAPVSDTRWLRFFEFVRKSDLWLLTCPHDATGIILSYQLPRLMIYGGRYKDLDVFNEFLNQYAVDVDPHYVVDSDDNQRHFARWPHVERDSADVQLDSVTLDRFQVSPSVRQLLISASNNIASFHEKAFDAIKVLYVAPRGSPSADAALYRALISCNPNNIEAVTIRMHENVMFWHDRCPSESSNALIDFVIRTRTYGPRVFLKISLKNAGVPHGSDWIIDRVTRALAQIPCNRKGALMLARLPRENFWKALGSLGSLAP